MNGNALVHSILVLWVLMDGLHLLVHRNINTASGLHMHWTMATRSNILDESFERFCIVCSNEKYPLPFLELKRAKQFLLKNSHDFNKTKLLMFVSAALLGPHGWYKKSKFQNTIHRKVEEWTMV